MTTLLLNGRIHSPTHPDATAMAIRGDTVAWLGSDDVARSQFPDADVTDLDGAFVAPAFVDSHAHVTSTGLLFSGLDLRAATSREHLLAMLAEHPHDDGVLWGHGWDDSVWSVPGAPTTAEIDAAVGARQVYLSRIDVHSALASTALRDGAVGVRIADGYHPDGPLSADAHHLVRARARAQLTDHQRHHARHGALDAFAAHGIVAVHECAGPQIGGLDDWQQLRDVDHGIDVIGYWGEAVSSAAQARDLLEGTGARGLAGDLFVDGALGSRTAWLTEPYLDGGGCGRNYLDPDAIAAHLRACTEARITAGFHVIGDAAVGAVVDALQQVVNDLGVPAVARCGHRLEHVEMINTGQAAKLGAWGVIASVQPNFDALWGGRDGMYAHRLGPDRASRLNPLSLLASSGVPLAFGSDSPVTGIDPWATIRAATSHRTDGLAVSARAAFAAATRGGWRAAGVRDGVTGTLTAGAPASYAVWDTDQLEVAAPADSVQRWSTDPRSRVPALPALSPEYMSPRCVQTVHRGRVLFG